MKFRPLSLAAWAFVVATMLAATVLLAVRPDLFDRLTREDSAFEWLGFLFFLAAGVALVRAGLARLRAGTGGGLGALLLLASLGFLWAAGEEISWGQRVLGIETPQFLAGVNRQRELNLHNINKTFFERAYRHGITVLVLTSAVAFALDRRRLLGLPLPDTVLVHAFALVPAYASYSKFSPEFQLGQLALPLYLGLAIARRQGGLLALTLATLAVIGIVAAAHLAFADRLVPNSLAEVREHLFAAVCAAYAVVLARDAA